MCVVVHVAVCVAVCDAVCAAVSPKIAQQTQFDVLDVLSHFDVYTCKRGGQGKPGWELSKNKIESRRIPIHTGSEHIHV